MKLIKVSFIDEILKQVQGDMTVIPDAEVYQSLDKICSGDEFSAKDKTCRLLRFLVDETLAGRGKI